MNEYIHKTDESKSAFAMNESSTTLDSDIGTFQFQDNRSEATRQLKLKKIANDYSASHLLQAKQIHQENESTIIQKSETGIANEKSIDVNTDIYLKTENSLESIMEAINLFLVKEGVPVVKPEISDKINTGAQFYFQEWKIQFSEEVLKATNFENPKDKDGLFALAYHEARHAEQIFRIARLLAKKDENAEAIKTKLNIPPKIAEEAVKKALPKEKEVTIEEKEADVWNESIYGAGGNKRTKVLEDFQNVVKNEKWLETLSENQLWYQSDDYEKQKKYTEGDENIFKQRVKQYFDQMDKEAKEYVVDKYLGKLKAIHTPELGTQLTGIHHYLVYIKDSYRIELAAMIKFLRNKKVTIDGKAIGEWDYERNNKSYEILDPFYGEIEGLRSKKELFIQEYKNLEEEKDAYDTQGKVEAVLAKKREKK